MILPANPLTTTRVLTAFAGEHLLAFPSAATGLISACVCSPPPPGGAPWLGGVAPLRGQLIWVLDPVGLCRNEIRPAGERLVVVIDGGGPHAGWGVAISAPSALADATPIRGEVLATCPKDWVRPCLLNDGRRAWLIDSATISTALGLSLGLGKKVAAA